MNDLAQRLFLEACEKTSVDSKTIPPETINLFSKLLAQEIFHKLQNTESSVQVVSDIYVNLAIDSVKEKLNI